MDKYEKEMGKTYEEMSIDELWEVIEKQGGFQIHSES
jgi:hypothetical protein